MSGAVLIGVSVLFGAGVGVLAGLLGVGGGFIVVPFLVFAAGLSQHQAQGTSLIAILPGAVAATITLRRSGVGDVDAGLRMGLRMGLLGAVGSLAGAAAALALPSGTLRVVFAVALALVGLRMLVGARRGG